MEKEKEKEREKNKGGCVWSVFSSGDAVRVAPRGREGTF